MCGRVCEYNLYINNVFMSKLQGSTVLSCLELLMFSCYIHL